MIQLVLTLVFWVVLGFNVYWTVQNYRAFRRWCRLNDMLFAICTKAMAEPAMRWTVTRVWMQHQLELRRLKEQR